MSLAEQLDHEMVVTDRAMATEVTIRVASTRGHRSADGAVGSALEVFHEVERACTRFDPTSDLMRVNRSPGHWHRVPPVLYAALEEASRAHQRSAGRFDPRVIGDLVALGYDRTLPFTAGAVATPVGARARRAHQPQAWRPRFRGGTREVLVGEAVDLGGIGKGLAVRWAARRLSSVSSDHLVEAGGDCYCAGVAPDGDRWRVGVEDPAGGDQPLAVLAVSDRAVTTSSIRLRRWSAGSQPVHHLIDPRTGRPGGDGLVAVTVVGDDPARAEVTSKVLFLAGRTTIARAARRHGIAAMWVDTNGELGVSPDMRRYVRWQR